VKVSRDVPVSYPGSDLRCCHRREIPANHAKPTRGLEPRTPSLRVVRRTSEDPCKTSVTASADRLEPAVNPLFRASGRHPRRGTRRRAWLTRRARRAARPSVSGFPACGAYQARGVRKSVRHAALAYSWMSPPSRSRRWIWSVGPELTTRRLRREGGVSASARCGLCAL